MMQPPMAYPNITINPVMKMIQGDDKSTEIVEKKIIDPSTSMMPVGDIIEAETTIGSLPDIVLKKDIEKVEDIAPKELDFSKGAFLVKKAE